MPRLSPIESQRTLNFLSYWKKKRRSILYDDNIILHDDDSPEVSLHSIISSTDTSTLTPTSALESTSSNSSSISSMDDNENNITTTTTIKYHRHPHPGWIICDDYRTDRFSENYYRHYWGIHKAGLVLGTFLGLIGVVSIVVGVAFIQ